MEKALDEKEPILLPQSGLEIRGGVLLCRKANGGGVATEPDANSKFDGSEAASLATVSRHRLGEIDSVELTGELSWGMLIMAAVLCGGGAYAVYLELEPRWLSWAATVVLGLVGLVLAAGSRCQMLTISTPHGRVHYELLDPPDVCEGFAVTLRSSIQTARGERVR